MKIILKVIISIMLILLMGCSDVTNIIKGNAEEIGSINRSLVYIDLDQVKDEIKLG